MRLSSEFWISAFIRQAEHDGDFCGLVCRGASHGGSVLVVVNRLNGIFDVYAAAPQAFVADDRDDRVFHLLLAGVDQEAVNLQIEKERRFDSDLWIVERESRDGRHGLSVIEI